MPETSELRIFKADPEARVRDMTPAELVAWMAWRVRRRASALLSGAARDVREARYGRR